MKMGTGIGFLMMCFLATISVPASAIGDVYNVTSFGAVGDGKTLDTTFIQAAIDKANSDGGGEVVFPRGRYVTVSLSLKSGVTLTIGDGVVIQASQTSSDWTSCNLKPVIGAVSQQDITIRGKGTIDGGAIGFYDSKGEFKGGDRPQSIIAFGNSSNVSVSGIRMQNSVRWTQVYDECDNLTVDGVQVRNRERSLGRETDGLDINSCRSVLIQNCDIETGDDGICLKPQNDSWQRDNPRTLHGVVVRNCVVASTCNAVKIGTGTQIEAYDATFDGITVNKFSKMTTSGKMIKTDRFGSLNGSCFAAIAVESNDGGQVHDMVFRNFTIVDCDTPIFIGLQNREEWDGHHRSTGFGKIYAISFEGIECARSARASLINTEAGGRIQDISFSNLNIHNFELVGPNIPVPARMTGAYPDAYLYGRCPCYGLFARDVDGLRLSPTCLFVDERNTRRPATVFESVSE